MPTIESTTFAPSLGVDLSTLTRTGTGLYYRDLAVGQGTEAQPGHRVAVRYQGSLADGTQFDATGPNDPPFTFLLGARQVISGWDQGVAGARVGGRRLLVIPPNLGYGARANGPIPANSILVFTVEIVDVK